MSFLIQGHSKQLHDQPVSSVFSMLLVACWQTVVKGCRQSCMYPSLRDVHCLLCILKDIASHIRGHTCRLTVCMVEEAFLFLLLVHSLHILIVIPAFQPSFVCTDFFGVSQQLIAFQGTEILVQWTSGCFIILIRPSGWHSEVS